MFILLFLVCLMWLYCKATIVAFSPALGNDKTIKILNISGGNKNTTTLHRTFTTLGMYQSLDWNPVDQRLYYINGTKIMSSFLNGTNLEILPNLTNVMAFGLDVVTQGLFYAEEQHIKYYSLFDHSTKTVAKQQYTISMVVIDPFKKLVFWSSLFGGLKRSNYDGSGRVDLINRPYYKPVITLDTTQEIIYYRILNSDKLRSMSYDGSRDKTYDESTYFAMVVCDSHLLLSQKNKIVLVGFENGNITSREIIYTDHDNRIDISGITAISLSNRFQTTTTQSTSSTYVSSSSTSISDSSMRSSLMTTTSSHPGVKELNVIVIVSVVVVVIGAVVIAGVVTYIVCLRTRRARGGANINNQVQLLELAR
ncbi:hypothetical protein SNE40_006497 [Patella caerulea]|uniref:Uncharacterized protein n=1 Tax=Patella caerulea TaxID=87958 RepID=A0AAN8Q697_PATCE